MRTSLGSLVLLVACLQFNVDCLSAFEVRRQPSQLENESEINYRLPTALKPSGYDLYIHPDLESGSFYGQEKIAIEVIENTDQIVLHAVKLKITSVYVSAAEVESFVLDEVREFLIIKLQTALQSGSTITLGLTFEGEMTGKLTGLYSSSYWTPSQERRTIATSKFEPTYARQAFPCFDEPALKARFKITLVHPTGDGFHALSNMDQEDEAVQGPFTEAFFSNSVPMSTYLACFIISDFTSKIKPVDTKGVGESFDIRIFSTRHQVDKVDFALDTAVAAIEFYLPYFKEPYPLPKLDMIAIPDFSSNAMENWGLVVYRESALLYDEDISSTWNKQRIGAVVAHELAHMWFGNLVTMDYWNDLWLNEGFARYMEYKCLNAIYPDWGMEDQFLLHALHGVLKFDSSTASHPIRQTVETPDQITEIFDTISYEKGASVIRMLEHVIGAERFAQGVTNYLNVYKYQNAVTDDFVREMEKLGLDFDVTRFMRTWTEQMGLPVIEVERTAKTMFRLTQKRFFSNIDDYNAEHSNSEFDYKWDIPVTYQRSNDDDIRLDWFYHSDPDIGISVPEETKWIKLNLGQVGFYRVNYDEETWHEILSALVEQPLRFSTADRAHLLNDIFALADAGQLSYDIAMDITDYLPKETEFVPWYVAASKLQSLQGILSQTDIYAEYASFSRGLVTNIYERFDWSPMQDDHTLRRLRVSIFSLACALELPDCLNTAALQFNSWLENPETKPEPDLREIVYYYGMKRAGTHASWEKMWQLFVAELDSTEKNKLMYGLAGIQEPWLLYRFVEAAQNEDYVRRQDYYACLQNIAQNPIGEPIVWDYVRENWPRIVERLGLNDRYLGRMIPTITERFASQTKLEEMQEFFAKYPEAGAGTVSRKQALETVKYNIQWLQANKQTLGTWLENKH